MKHNQCLAGPCSISGQGSGVVVTTSNGEGSGGVVSSGKLEGA